VYDGVVSLAPKPVETRISQCVMELRGQILQGVFQPGERIAEVALAARLGVSRTPLRLALDRLAGEGLLEPGAHGGFLVREFAPADMWDAIELRGVLEGTAARLAAERLRDPSELEALRECAARIDPLVPVTPEEFSRYLACNDEFHAELKRLSKSRMVIEAIDRVIALPFAAPGALVSGAAEPAIVERASVIAQEHHRALIEAIAQREGTRAEAIAREHCRLARRNLACALEHGGTGAELPGALRRLQFAQQVSDSGHLAGRRRGSGAIE
jgi:GntR family transcriptional regulator of vanillate catabolism